MLQIRLDQKAFLFHDLQPIISDNSSVLGSRFISDQYTNTLFPLQDLLGIDMEEDEVWIRLPMESFQGRCVELVVRACGEIGPVGQLAIPEGDQDKDEYFAGSYRIAGFIALTRFLMAMERWISIAEYINMPNHFTDMPYLLMFMIFSASVDRVPQCLTEDTMISTFGLGSIDPGVSWAQTLSETIRRSL
ncbi:hypothetical protein PHYBLDRAFT_138057 [Phycomyces blakesleeanus NRRL 1555(-)]|uniref:Uncharacterized protein n=1 Tax=Phycomyces blakesleeanus (strain ATCC 8743b / DSM 1359 / FGSC 10004 / NBRC 33097 / NRRL 1555) TaxID=763407 RepID=A0A167QZ35_PHYB8|nr:hypothetical protein PHYBLDRAFT_138057 [Phycomyces blakesleeanus NRRL 1555(-)]OAD80499.1 hypothetical protein PHYBLDRAFT_138057 [Phycomyces blakesleeanus NRRL 1555(-)]|eukprot:XP_018298539.1 hypothetical protein PHYBLDRAFT_138057 [Phycomyces blakesleeanus NRRL 1555(-)]